MEITIQIFVKLLWHFIFFLIFNLAGKLKIKYFLKRAREQRIWKNRLDIFFFYNVLKVNMTHLLKYEGWVIAGS